MNILLIGEFSSFAKHLATGFRNLGHKVVVVHTGDVWKKISGSADDVKYAPKNMRLFNKDIKGSWRLTTYFVTWKLMKDIRERFDGQNIDLVVVVNFCFLSRSYFKPGVQLSFLKKMIAKGSKLIMSVCGFDPACCLVHPQLYKWEVPLQEPRYVFLINNADAIVPTSLNYHTAISTYCKKFNYRQDKISAALPLPIDIDGECVIESCVGRKIVIFHGVIRPEEKGTKFIQEAMRRLQVEYPDKVECVCKGGMPYDEYLKLFNKVDILVDQVTDGGRGWGMNAAIGAMKGKCVLTNCGQDVADVMGFEKLPFIDIRRDSNQIYEALKSLILSPEDIDAKKRESREFMVENCDCKVVAQRYLEIVGL